MDRAIRGKGDAISNESRFDCLIGLLQLGIQNA